MAQTAGETSVLDACGEAVRRGMQIEFGIPFGKRLRGLAYDAASSAMDALNDTAAYLGRVRWPMFGF